MLQIQHIKKRVPDGKSGTEGFGRCESESER